MLKMRMLMVLLVVLLLSLSGVLADSSDRAILCGDLPETDCQILLNNADVMDSLNSFAFLMNINLNASGDDAMQLTLNGGGALSLADEALHAANAMSETMSGADMSALAELLLTSLEADVWVELQGEAAEEDFDMGFNLLLKDGVVLVGAEALEAVTGEPMTGIDAIGIDLNDAIGEMLEETGAMPAMDADEMEAAEMAAISVARLADSELNGVAVAVFESDFDLNTILSLISAEQLVGASDDMEDSQAAAQMMEAIDVSEFSVRQYIGLGDSYTYRIVMALDMTMASESGDLDADAQIVMDMSIDLSNFNEPVEVEIPEDAFVFPLAMMLTMGSQ